MKPVPHGEPYAGNLHVRFDEGAGVPDTRGAPLYSTPFLPRKTYCGNQVCLVLYCSPLNKAVIFGVERLPRIGV